jgi:hypothetical protein
MAVGTVDRLRSVGLEEAALARRLGAGMTNQLVPFEYLEVVGRHRRTNNWLDLAPVGKERQEYGEPLGAIVDAETFAACPVGTRFKLVKE